MVSSFNLISKKKHAYLCICISSKILKLKLDTLSWLMPVYDITMLKETSRYDRTKMGIDVADLEGTGARDIESSMHLCTRPDRLPVWETVSKLVGLFP